MNFFAHGREFLEDGYFVAGTAVPDWLNVVDRKMRVRGKHATPFAVQEPPGPLRSLAQGVLQHLEDDRWFHQTRAFAELSLKFAVQIRDLSPDDTGLRPSFLGHILVELLLDAQLITDDPSRLAAYYRTLESLDGEVVQRSVNAMATRSSNRVAELVDRFCRERFLYDYLEDETLLWRVGQVLKRVGLEGVPPGLNTLLPELRAAVAARADELLERPQPAPNPSVDYSN